MAGWRKQVSLYWTASRAARDRGDGINSDRVVFVQLTPLGDAATLAPVCRTLVASGTSVDIVCKGDLGDLWHEALPNARVIPLPGSTWDPKTIHQWLEPLTQVGHDTVFVTSMLSQAAFLASLIPAKFRFGMMEQGRRWDGSRLLDDRVNVARDEHVLSRFNRLIQLRFPEFVVGENDGRIPASSDVPRADSGNAPILLHPGGKWKPRRWPPERFLELARELYQAAGKQVEVAVHVSETDLLDFFGPHEDGNRLKIARLQNLTDLLNAVKRCSLLIGNDSGPAHLANLYGKPIVVLWGPGNEKRIRPLGDKVAVLIHPIECRPCRQYKNDEVCSRGVNECLQQITVKEVLSAASNIL